MLKHNIKLSNLPGVISCKELIVGVWLKEIYSRRNGQFSHGKISSKENNLQNDRKEPPHYASCKECCFEKL